MKKTRKKRGARMRSVSIQIRIRVKRPGNVKLTKAFLADAVRYRAENGEDLPGVEITGVYWQNPSKEYEYTGDQIDGALNAMLRFMNCGARVFHAVREDQG